MSVLDLFKSRHRVAGHGTCSVWIGQLADMRLTVQYAPPGRLHSAEGGRVPQHVPAALLERGCPAGCGAAPAPLPSRAAPHQRHTRLPHRPEQAPGELPALSALSGMRWAVCILLTNRPRWPCPCLCLQFDEEAEEFGDDFLSDKDPSILHFLLASGDEVRTLP